MSHEITSSSCGNDHNNGRGNLAKGKICKDDTNPNVCKDSCKKGKMFFFISPFLYFHACIVNIDLSIPHQFVLQSFQTPSVVWKRWKAI